MTSTANRYATIGVAGRALRGSNYDRAAVALRHGVAALPNGSQIVAHVTNGHVTYLGDFPGAASIVLPDEILAAVTRGEDHNVECKRRDVIILPPADLDAVFAAMREELALFPEVGDEDKFSGAFGTKFEPLIWDEHVSVTAAETTTFHQPAGSPSRGAVTNAAGHVKNVMFAPANRRENRRRILMRVVLDNGEDLIVGDLLADDTIVTSI